MTRPGSTDGSTVLVSVARARAGDRIRESLGQDAQLSVSIAIGAAEGVKRALAWRPDVILVDVRAGELDGAGIVHDIRAQPELDRSFLVLLTDPDDEALRTTLLHEGGAQDYLKAPVSADELRTRIRNVLAAKRTLEAEARLSSLIEQAPDGIFIADLEGRYTHVNGAGCRMLGCERDEVIGKTILDLIPPEDAPRLLASKEQMLVGAVHIAEWRLRRKDGSFLPVEVSAKILPDGRWQGFVRDISERKRLEHALRTSEARSSGILSISADAIVSVDDQQRITMFNDGAEKIFGYARSEVIGKRLEILIPERFREAHRRNVAALTADRGMTSRRMGGPGAHITGHRKNGEEFPADVAVSRLEVEGTPVLTASVRDMTEPKKLEEALRRAIRARDEILGIVAHDLRNPLQAIVGQAALLHRLDGGPERRTMQPADSIEHAVERMNRLIQDLLDVTRLDVGGLHLDRAPVAARPLVLESVESQRALAEAARLELTLDLPDELPDLRADRDRLLQIFENLIGNAIKFTSAGGRVTVGATIAEGEVQFRVVDTGCGIAPAELPHVFDRFWQGREGERSGAGLGLAIVKGVVEAHGGRAWATSTPGRGSTFFFTIPTVASTAPSGRELAAAIR